MKQRSMWHQIAWAAFLCVAPAVWGVTDSPQNDSEAAVERSATRPAGPFSPSDETFTGTVVAVLDGDTLSVVRGDSTELVCLYGIDCPELDQPYGKQARRFTSDLTLRRLVTVSIAMVDDKAFAARTRDERRFEARTHYAAARVPNPANQDKVYADVILADGSVLNQALLEAGLAWWNPGSSGEQSWKLKKLLAEAVSAKRGLWADNAPLAPWTFRKREAEEAALRAERREKVGRQDPGSTSQEGVFVTHWGRQYHRYGCRYLDKSKKVMARSEAVEKGYQPCLLCFPETLNRQHGRELALKGTLSPVLPAGQASPEQVLPPPELQPPEQVLPPPDLQPPTLLPPLPQTDDLISLMARHRPRLVRDDDGVVVGITADDISAVPYADMVGLQDGDVIHMVNGVWIDSIDTAFGLAQDLQLQGVTEFEIVVLRDDGPQTLYFSLS